VSVPLTERHEEEEMLQLAAIRLRDRPLHQKKWSREDKQEADFMALLVKWIWAIALGVLGLWAAQSGLRYLYEATLEKGEMRFEIARRYAERASILTGVDPALLLAIAEVETGMGRNVGRCRVFNLETGEGQTTGGVLVRNFLKVDRDVAPLREFVEATHSDVYSIILSCPADKNGYGGGIGPLQITPWTWKSIRQELKDLSGRVDVRDPQTAFIAAGIVLRDNGAIHTAPPEKMARGVRRYHAGGNHNGVAGRRYWTKVCRKQIEFASRMNRGI
jgi:membrane-bound lytic murein transglycosylase B